jgi:glycosyltransferase involved in cell wall biosynthesis
MVLWLGGICVEHPAASELLADVELSIVVPMWNEGARIERTLTVLTEAFRARSAEIIISDDGSSDDSADRVHSWIRQNPGAGVVFTSLVRHGGKGAALRQGIALSSGATVAYIDADLDIPVSELVCLDLLLHQDGRRPDKDVLVGSKRASIWRTPGVPFARRIVSSGFAECVRIAFGLPVRDTQTGLKLFPGPWLRSVVGDVDLDGFLFDLELLVRAHADGYRLTEVPVMYAPQRRSNRISFAHLVACVGELVRVYWRTPRRRTPRSMPSMEAQDPAHR